MADLNNTWKEKARRGTEFYSGCKLHRFSLKELEALDTSFKFRMVSRMKEMKIRHKFLKCAGAVVPLRA